MDKRQTYDGGFIPRHQGINPYSAEFLKIYVTVA